MISIQRTSKRNVKTQNSMRQALAWSLNHEQPWTKCCCVKNKIQLLPEEERWQQSAGGLPKAVSCATLPRQACRLVPLAFNRGFGQALQRGGVEWQGGVAVSKKHTQQLYGWRCSWTRQQAVARPAASWQSHIAQRRRCSRFAGL